MSDAVWLALISAVSSIIGAVLAIILKRIQTVHLLVNDKMSSALDKIANLEKRLGVPHSESDEKHEERKAADALAKPELEAIHPPRPA